MPTVLVTDYAWPTLDIERRMLAGVQGELLVAERGDEAELRALAPRADAIMTNWRQVPASVLDAAPACVTVARYGIGLDNIDVDRATALGMIVTNVPDFCVEEVADHTVSLLLACARRLFPQVRSTRAGAWDRAAGGTPTRIRGQVLGLVGYGRLARGVAARAQAVGLEVLAYTPRLRPGPMPDGATATNDLDELLQTSDYVSLHVPSTPQTRHLIDERALRRMKPSAFLINTARGVVVDEDALARAIAGQWIAGAALDVLQDEPPPPDHPLLRMDNVLVTPHAAFYSDVSIPDLQERTAANVAAVLSGRRPDHVVNPAVLDQDNLRARRLQP